MQDRKTIFTSFIQEVWNEGNVEAYSKYIHPDAVLHLAGMPEDLRGIEAIKGWARSYRAGFPNIHIVVEEVVAEGDSVLLRWTSSQTHTGEYMGIPATGGAASISALQFAHFDGAKMREIWLMFDPLRVLLQLDVLPPMPMPKPLIVLLMARRWIRRAFARRGNR
jgi:predicted ester cyclase